MPRHGGSGGETGGTAGQVIRDFLAAALLAAILAALLELLVFREAGIFLVTVEGRSMHPLFESGDIVLVEKVKPSDIHVGDIIVYRGCGGHLIIHRVFKVCVVDGSYCYVTWGDNNPVPDLPLISCTTYRCGNFFCIPYSRVLGKVIGPDDMIYKVPFIGGLAALR